MHITIAPKAYSNIAYNIHLHVDLLFMQTNKLFNARRSLWICNNWTKSNLLLIQPFTEAIIQTNVLHSTLQACTGLHDIPQPVFNNNVQPVCNLFSLRSPTRAIVNDFIRNRYHHCVCCSRPTPNPRLSCDFKLQPSGVSLLHGRRYITLHYIKVI